MKNDAGDLEAAVLRLPAEQRAALAGKLIESLETPTGQDFEAAWAIEVERRVAELDSGTVPTVPWEEARRRIRGE